MSIDSLDQPGGQGDTTKEKSGDVLQVPPNLTPEAFADYLISNHLDRGFTRDELIKLGTISQSNANSDGTAPGPELWAKQRKDPNLPPDDPRQPVVTDEATKAVAKATADAADAFLRVSQVEDKRRKDLYTIHLKDQAVTTAGEWVSAERKAYLAEHPERALQLPPFIFKKALQQLNSMIKGRQDGSASKPKPNKYDSQQ